jgi:hypothetical protein
VVLKRAAPLALAWACAGVLWRVTTIPALWWVQVLLCGLGLVVAGALLVRWKGRWLGWLAVLAVALPSERGRGALLHAQRRAAG